jgi:cytochrome P450
VAHVTVDLSITQPLTPPAGARRVSDIIAVDLTDPLTFGAGIPHDAFDVLRSTAPVAWHDEKSNGWKSTELHSGIEQPESPGFWALTSHEHVSIVSKDPELYSSYLGGTQMFSADEMLLTGLRLMLLYMDPPDQTRLRKILVPSFTPKSIDLMKGAVADNARALADAIAGSGTVDLVATVNKELPTRTIALLLGMPEEDWHLIPQWSDSLIGAESAEATEEDLMGSVITFQEVHDYGAKIFEERRRNPCNDIVSSLATAEVDGEQLSVEEFCMFWLLLIVAGNETTRNSLSGGIVALHEHGLWNELAARIAAGGTVDQSVTDELVRHVSPVMHFRRTATRDHELGGQLVRAGDKVVMWYGAANRDPGVFADPHALNIDRGQNPHLGFGIGPHFCLGTRLARLQISTMLDELLRRFPNMTLDGDPVRVSSTFINGVERLPVRLG